MRKTRWIVVAVGLTGAVLAVAAVWALRVYRRPPQPPEPPAVDLIGVDPEIAQAVEEAEEGVRKAPQSRESWGRLGMVLAAHDFRPQALVVLAEAERLDPENGRWPYFQGLILQPDEPEQAIVKLRRAAELAVAARSRDRAIAAAVCVHLAQLLLNQGHLDEAESAFHQAERADPSDARAQLGLAQVAHAQGNLKRSLEYAQPVTADPRTSKAAHLLLAEVYAKMQEEAAADRERRSAADLPDDAPGADPYFDEGRMLRVGLLARIDRANGLGRANRPREVITLLHDTVQLYPDSDWAWLNFGLAYLRVNNYQAAETAFRQAVRLGPGRFESNYDLGLALYKQHEHRPGALAEAAEAFRKAIHLVPTDPQAHLALGSCLREQGDWGDAVAAFRAALGCRLEYPDAQRELGQLLADIARQAAAAACLQRMVRSPAAIDVALPIWVEAVAHLSHAARLAPQDPANKEALDRLQAEFPQSPTASREPVP